jgi:hypothetical protein
MTDESASGPAPGLRQWLCLGSCAALLITGSVLVGQDVGEFPAWIWTIIATAAGCGGLVLGTALVCRRYRLGPGFLVAVVLVAVAARLLLLSSHRYLSDDAYRYHWDGKVIAQGINPYKYAPEDPRLDSLKTVDMYRHINHPDRITVYPPLAEAYFALAYQLSPESMTGFQILALLSELVAWLLLLWELGRRKLPKAWLLLAAWSPLIIYESYLPGHVDTLALPWLAFLLIALGRKWPLRLGLALAGTCLIKPIAVIFVPAIIWQLGLKDSLKTGLVFIAIVALCYLPFLTAGYGLVSSMWLMAKYWSFNGSLAAIAEALLPQAFARVLMAALLTDLLIWSAWWGKDLRSRLILAAAAFVVCTTTLFPWYLIFVFPLLVLRPDPALLALGILVPLSEMVVIDYHLQGVWELPLWISLVTYIPFYVLLVKTVIQRGNSSRSLAENT